MDPETFMKTLEHLHLRQPLQVCLRYLYSVLVTIQCSSRQWPFTNVQNVQEFPYKGLKNVAMLQFTFCYNSLNQIYRSLPPELNPHTYLQNIET